MLLGSFLNTFTHIFFVLSFWKMSLLRSSDNENHFGKMK